MAAAAVSVAFVSQEVCGVTHLSRPRDARAQPVPLPAHHHTLYQPKRSHARIREQNNPSSSEVYTKRHSVNAG